MPTLADKHILVCGLARNCGRHIAAEVRHLGAAFAGAASLQWLVIESDSDDDTLAVLDTLAREQPGFRYRSLGRLRDTLPLRTERIAHCRNRYLDELAADPAYAGVSHVVVADLDGVNRLLTPQAVLSCWARSDWDVCTANQAGPYYDVWALRHPLWSPNDCWAQRDFLWRYSRDTEGTLEASVYARMVTIPPDADWIEVESAFGGLAIYQRRALDGARYRGLDGDGRETCEHVALHAHLRASGSRIFVNPALVNSACSEHTEPLRAGPSARRMMKRLMRRLKSLWGL